MFTCLHFKGDIVLYLHLTILTANKNNCVNITQWPIFCTLHLGNCLSYSTVCKVTVSNVVHISVQPSPMIHTHTLGLSKFIRIVISLLFVAGRCKLFICFSPVRRDFIWRTESVCIDKVCVFISVLI